MLEKFVDKIPTFFCEVWISSAELRIPLCKKDVQTINYLCKYLPDAPFRRISKDIAVPLRDFSFEI